MGIKIDINESSKGKVNEYKIFHDGPYGGQGGSNWNDMPKVIVNGPLTAIEIRSDEEIDAIRARYGIFFYLNNDTKGSCSCTNPVDKTWDNFE